MACVPPLLAALAASDHTVESPSARAGIASTFQVSPVSCSALPAPACPVTSDQAVGWVSWPG